VTSFGVSREERHGKTREGSVKGPRMVGAGSLGLQGQAKGPGLVQPGEDSFSRKLKPPQHLQGGYQKHGTRLFRGAW